MGEEAGLAIGRIIKMKRILPFSGHSGKKICTTKIGH
jgi:hypothetical protein